MNTPPSSSFCVRRVNRSTFLIIERDLYGEHPFIYAKLHSNVPIIILSDTGCDRPDNESKNADITHLRPFLETYPVPELNGRPINPGGLLRYVIILSHCHYDHIGGIGQFLEGGKTEIIASAAGRDFIESDLGAHSLCNQTNIPTPVYKVTHWAQSNEHLVWPLPKKLPGDDAVALQDDEDSVRDLGIMMFHTPGHTPDSLSWFDYEERTLYVGDSLYLLSDEMEPIYFPPQGDLAEWLVSLNKLLTFVTLNESHDVSTESVPYIKLSAAHTTCNVNAWRCLDKARMFGNQLIFGSNKPLGSSTRFGETFDYYMIDVGEPHLPNRMAMLLPRRLVDYAKIYYAVQDDDRGNSTSSCAAVLRSTTT